MPAPPDSTVLILAPVGQDGRATAAMLEAQGIATRVCSEAAECTARIAAGAGALLFTEEALELPGMPALLEALKAQPPWSELPLIVLTRGGESRVNALLDVAASAAGSITLLERPMLAITLLHSVQVALRSRRRQYELRGLLASLEDKITERKQFQAELERLVAERTARLQEMVGELEHFSYTITHDMRAPLRAMQGFAELFTEAYASGQQQDAAHFLQRVRTAATRMDRLITDALNYNKAIRQELPIEPVDPAGLLRGMLDTYPEFQSPKAQVEIRGKFPRVMANEAGLTQCFSNLLGNAVKFAKPGQTPRIRIWAEPRWPSPRTAPSNSLQPSRPPILNPEPSSHWVRIWIEDNGIGISQLLVPRVFDMFARGQTNCEGTGIGLALVRKVMDRMGGKAGVESEEGQGSRFWLDLAPG